jgi:hypothetical protein
LAPSSPKSPPAAHAPPRANPEAPQPPDALLAGALRERLSIIADRDWYGRDAAGHLQALMQASERILTFSAQLPAPVHPQLKHYLERCSYDKALAFLSGAAPSENAHAL